MAATNPYAEITVVPRIAVQLPLPLPPPRGFDAARPETWPEVVGRLEYVNGRIEYMPLCGEVQQRTVADVVTELNQWARGQEDFVVGANEAGMLLGGEVRAADAAVWKKTPGTPGFARVPPILAVEVTGADESVEDLAPKVAWYLSHGVEIVWVLDPTQHVVVVSTASGSVTVRQGRVPAASSLPGLEPRV